MSPTDNNGISFFKNIFSADPAVIRIIIFLGRFIEETKLASDSKAKAFLSSGNFFFCLRAICSSLYFLCNYTRSASIHGRSIYWKKGKEQSCNINRNIS